MSGDVHQLPTVPHSERLIERAMLRGHFAAGIGDLVLVCTDAAGDDWTFLPVASVDSFGNVLGVQLEDRRTLSLWQAQDPAMRPMFVNSVHDFEAEGFASVRWKTFRGLEAARLALKPHFIGEPRG